MDDVRVDAILDVSMKYVELVIVEIEVVCGGGGGAGEGQRRWMVLHYAFLSITYLAG